MPFKCISHQWLVVGGGKYSRAVEEENPGVPGLIYPLVRLWSCRGTPKNFVSLCDATSPLFPFHPSPPSRFSFHPSALSRFFSSHALSHFSFHLSLTHYFIFLIFIGVLRAPTALHIIFIVVLS